MDICRLKNVTSIFCIFIAISLTSFGQTLLLEQQHTPVLVVLCLVVFPSIELTAPVTGINCNNVKRASYLWGLVRGIWGALLKMYLCLFCFWLSVYNLGQDPVQQHVQVCGLQELWGQLWAQDADAAGRRSRGACAAAGSCEDQDVRLRHAHAAASCLGYWREVCPTYHSYFPSLLKSAHTFAKIQFHITLAGLGLLVNDL